MIRTLKQLVRNSAFFRKLFAFPIQKRADLLYGNIRRQGSIYQDVVISGTLTVRPRNLPYHFLVSARSELAKRVVVTGAYEPELGEIIASAWKGNGSILNIGANIGFWSLGVITLCPSLKRVFAVEPNPEAFQLLKENILQNQLETIVIPIQACVSSHQGTVSFETIPGMPEYSSIGNIVHDAVSGCERVRVKIETKPLHAFTEFQAEQIDLILIDAEGAEYLVFSGSEDWLKKYKPTIIFECSETLLSKFGHSVAMIRSLLEKIGYIVRDARAQGLSVVDGFEGEAIAMVK